jgi:hypothetical protein
MGKTGCKVLFPFTIPLVSQPRSAFGSPYSIQCKVHSECLVEWPQIQRPFKKYIELHSGDHKPNTAYQKNKGLELSEYQHQPYPHSSLANQVIHRYQCRCQFLLLHCPHLCLPLRSLRGQELDRLEGTEIWTSQTFVVRRHSCQPTWNYHASALHRLPHLFRHYIDT